MFLEGARLLFFLCLAHLIWGLFENWDKTRWLRVLLLLRLSVVSTFAAWVIGFWQADLSIVYVAQHQHNLHSIAGGFGILWAGAAGANLLFWWVMGESTSMALAQINDEMTPALLPRLQKIVLPHLIFMALVVLWHSNPFAHYWPFPPEQAAELNPLLQHQALSYHPPLLLTGTASLFGLIVIEGAQRLSPKSLPSGLRRKWLCGSLGVLGFGIVAGSHWAYHVLGWGGWWFWDPIETISLISWCGGMALLHHREEQAGVQRWNALSVWASIVLGLVLVRGGALVSVHSFVQENPSALLLSWGAWSMLSLLWPLMHQKSRPPATAAMGLIFTTMIMIAGLSLPVVLALMGQGAHHLAPSYYESTLATCLLFFLILDRAGQIPALGYLGWQSLFSGASTPFVAGALLIEEWRSEQSVKRKVGHTLMLLGLGIIALAPSFEFQELIAIAPGEEKSTHGIKIKHIGSHAQFEDPHQKWQHELILTYRNRPYRCLVEKVFYPSWDQQLSPIVYLTTERGEDIGLSATPEPGEFRLFYRPFVRWVWGLMLALSAYLLSQSALWGFWAQIKERLLCVTPSWLLAFLSPLFGRSPWKWARP